MYLFLEQQNGTWGYQIYESDGSSGGISKISAILRAGRYKVVVKGRRWTSRGEFRLTYRQGAAAEHTTEIDYSHDGEHRSYFQIVVENVKNTQAALAAGLGADLGCTNVKVCLTAVQRSGFFESNGTYTIHVNARCARAFSQFRLKTVFAFDWEETSTVEVSYYDTNSSLVHRKYSLPEIPYGSYSNSIDPLPICFE